jgi:uncharacterized membrane protein YbhN (UPF0104 family)
MRRAAGTLVKLALAAVVGVFIWRSLASNWSEFGAIEFDFRLQLWWIVLAALVTWLTYAIQIASWRTVLSGWGQHIAYRDAARAWCVANLGRYVPGKLWSVAGLVALAQRSGVAPWAAGASAVVIQALGVATGVIVAAATLRPGTLAVGLAIALAVAVATLALLAWERAVRWAGSTVGLIAGLRALPVTTVLASGALTLTSWVTYGAAFWCLARGLGLTGLPVAVAVGVFALGYLVGLMAVFVPGGVGVRELAFVGQLTPLLGSGPAIGVSVASRLLLTITEVTAALFALGASRKPEENPVEHTER